MLRCSTKAVRFTSIHCPFLFIAFYDMQPTLRKRAHNSPSPSPSDEQRAMDIDASKHPRTDDGPSHSEVMDAADGLLRISSMDAQARPSARSLTRAMSNLSVNTENDGERKDV